MNKYKRWILILTALTVFVIHVESLRATSLIHAGKFSKLLNATASNSTSNSTTTTTTESSGDRLRAILDELPDDDDGVIDVNGTKITLTGIPQIDYVWDPNLPRELNGFNLSTYPFLDSMPAEEDISFDCDDKKNGFYASIKYSCQLYHHCLYGVRSDFICANFTAFDQKTFICHFVSEVDCKNSYKYWHRNDDLYKATTTTASSLIPLFDRGFYNRTRNPILSGGASNINNGGSSSSALSSSSSSSSQQQQHSSDSSSSSNKINNNKNSNNAPQAQSNNGDDFYGGGGNRPQRPPLRRPPYRRRRPPVDYYYYDDDYEDDVYDDRGRRRNRPRNRRPIYDDYDARRPDNRRPYYDDFDDYEYERRPAMRNRNRDRPESRNNNNSNHNNDERRRYEDRRGGDSTIRRRPAFEEERRPVGDDRRRNSERRPYGANEERKFSDDKQDERVYTRRNPLADDKRVRPLQQTDVNDRKQTTEESISDEKLIKPVGSASIFERARPPPKISRPVPLSEKSKFAYKSDSKNKEKNEEYEEYDDEILPISSSTTSSSTTTHRITPTISSTPKPFSFQKLKPLSTLKPITTTTTSTTIAPALAEIEYYDDEYYDTVVTTPSPKPIENSSIKQKDERASLFNSRAAVTSGSTTTTQASSPESFRLNRYKNDNSRENVQQSNLQLYIDSSTTTTTTTKKPQSSIISNNNNNNSKKYANKQTVFEPVTQETLPVVKAATQGHFQNLYNSRNLEKQEVEIEDREQQKQAVRVIKRPFLPSRGGNPYKARGLQPVGVLAEQIEEPQYTAAGIDVRQASNDESAAKITLEDLYNEEYDVDLNDALNPMLKPLTSSRNVNSYSPNSSGDVGDKDRYKSQSQKVIHKADHFVPVTKASSTIATTTSTTPQPEYYDDELEYTYADDVA